MLLLFESKNKMSSFESDIGSLSEPQKLALQSYTSITNQELDAAISLLQRSEWNVEIAVAKFFDGESPDLNSEALASQSLPPPRLSRQLNLHDSLQFSNSRSLRSEPQRDPAPRIVPQPNFEVIRRPPYLITVFFAPFSLLYRLISSSISIFAHIIPFSRHLLPINFLPFRQNMTRRPLKPRDCAARLKREFEEEYGANSLPFYEGGYAQALDLAKSDLKFLIILLIAPEHDDTSSFIKETLLDSAVQSYLGDRENNIIFWAGDVRDTEAYQVSAALKCSKFPYTAVVAHTPEISSSSMSVITTVTGPIDAAAYVAKLAATVSKYKDQLVAIRASRSAQNFERTLRQEQDSAYERSLARDRERARLKREAQEAAAKAELQQQARQAAAAELAVSRLQWRKWRAMGINPEPESSEKDIVKIALKMPEQNGAGRVIRKFRSSDPIEELYAFVECHDLLSNDEITEKPNNYDHEYQFLLVQSFPRVVYHVNDRGTIGEKVGKTGNLIVELINPEQE